MLGLIESCHLSCCALIDQRRKAKQRAVKNVMLSCHHSHSKRRKESQNLPLGQINRASRKNRIIRPNRVVSAVFRGWFVCACCWPCQRGLRNWRKSRSEPDFASVFPAAEENLNFVQFRGGTSLLILGFCKSTLSKKKKKGKKSESEIILRMVPLSRLLPS